MGSKVGANRCPELEQLIPQDSVQGTMSMTFTYWKLVDHRGSIVMSAIMFLSVYKNILCHRLFSSFFPFFPLVFTVSSVLFRYSTATFVFPVFILLSINLHHSYFLNSILAGPGLIFSEEHCVFR